MGVLDELKTEFSEINFEFEDEVTVSAYASLCALYSVSAAQLAASWEVFTLNSNVEGGTVRATQLSAFKLHLNDEQKAAQAKQERESSTHFYARNDLEDPYDPPLSAPSTPAALPGAPQDLRTPASLVATAGRSSAYPTTPFSQRTNKHAVQAAYSGHLAAEPERPSVSQASKTRSRRPIRRCHVEALGAAPEPGCRYMYDRTEDRDKVAVVGRICCEGDGGRLNDKSTLLEGSAQHLGGARVKLDLRNIPSFSLVPGQ
eukprot:jgi/Mesen1/9787/ME000007S09851